jgi:hypothetical protein
MAKWLLVKEIEWWNRRLVKVAILFDCGEDIKFDKA